MTRPARPRKPGLVLLAGRLFHFAIDPDDWDFIVAADGGARHALQQHVFPDHVVGDFDSLAAPDKQKLTAAGVSMTRLPTAKDMTDGEAAVRWAIERRTTSPRTEDAGRDAPDGGAKSTRAPRHDIVIAGGLGGRFDHALGSVILLEQLLLAGLDGFITDGRQQVFLLYDGLQVAGHPGDLLSVVPLGAKVSGLGVRGARWPLHDFTLRASSTLTISNEFSAPLARFSVRQGRAVVVRVPKHST